MVQCSINKKDICVAVDKDWKKIWKFRYGKVNYDLESLKINKLDTLLVHDAKDTDPEKMKFFSRWAEKQKDSNRLSRVGVSVYEGQEINRIPRELLEVVQLPMSIYDQRAIDEGTIKRLMQTESSIQIRSIFMQGLLLQPENRWPSWIDEATKKHHKEYMIDWFEVCTKRGTEINFDF